MKYTVLLIRFSPGERRIPSLVVRVASEGADLVEEEDGQLWFRHEDIVADARNVDESAAFHAHPLYQLVGKTTPVRGAADAGRSGAGSSNAARSGAGSSGGGGFWANGAHSSGGGESKFFVISE